MRNQYVSRPESHPMTAHPANDLFSHPETHRSHANPKPSDDEQRSYTNLFREPAPTPRRTA